jgi:hypothetical protein
MPKYFFEKAVATKATKSTKAAVVCNKAGCTEAKERDQ